MFKPAILFTLIFSVCAWSQVSHSKLNIKDKKVKAKISEKSAKAMAKIKGHCGCTPKVSFDESNLSGKDVSATIGGCFGSLEKVAKGVCKEYKKEFCDGVKSVHFSPGDIKTATLKSGKLSSHYDASKRKSCSSIKMKNAVEEGL